MKSMIYTISLVSEALPAAGISATAVLDADVTTDELGLPIIPAKRLKGLLLESLTELEEMTGRDTMLKTRFGSVGDAESNSLQISDAVPVDYDALRRWLDWAGRSYPGYFQAGVVTDTFTIIRQQTGLQDGVAAEHSLRTSRVLKKGQTFTGSVGYEPDLTSREAAELILVLHNLRFLGSHRNRGFGFVKCTVSDPEGKGPDLNIAWNTFMEDAS